jgi:hypothetical protein
MVYAYTHERREPQHLVDTVETLDLEDELPQDFHYLAPEDQTVEVACFFARKNPMTPRDMRTQTAIIVAWERGEISGFEAFDHLEANEVMPYDDMLMAYAAIMRARAALEDGRAL